MVSIRENWRVFLLVVVLLVSAFALFSPTMGGDDAPTGNQADQATNLVYGLQLSGGTRIRAPLDGYVAAGVDVPTDADERSQLEATVAENLDGTLPRDVEARPAGTYGTSEQGTIEVTQPNVTRAGFTAALDAAGVEYDDGEVHQGVSDQTREETVEVLRNKVNQAGLSGGSVQSVSSATSREYFILIEVPGEDSSEVIDLIEDRGTVRIDVYPQLRDGERIDERRRAVLNQEDFRNIGTATEAERSRGYYVPVSIRDSVAPEFEGTMVETGVAQPGGSTCRGGADGWRNSSDPCLLLVVDDQVVNAFGMDSDLAADMQNRQWSQSPRFRLTTTNFSESQEVALNLRAGALPANVNLSTGAGTSSFISPGQGERFKSNSLLTGLFAVFAVSGVVFLRYGSARVALPMIVTALSEVAILLGFAAAIGYPLDLSVIAGFIAVVGTGVDDLIIIADEVMSQGEVRSRKVFQSRFRKAFWVIGAAAATTIIAMSPLAVLSLGDLQGFAIFTILGVVVGVLLTRPAYGDILRALLTDDR